jgi:hypothetical protein
MTTKGLAVIAVVLAVSALYFEREQISTAVRQCAPAQAYAQSKADAKAPAIARAATTALMDHLTRRGCTLSETQQVEVKTTEGSSTCVVSGVAVIRNPDVPESAPRPYGSSDWRMPIMSGTWNFKGTFDESERGYGLLELSITDKTGLHKTLAQSLYPVDFYHP